MATTFNVINNNNFGAGSFRQAIIDLNLSPVENSYIIDFNPNLDISIINNLQIIQRSVTINGNNSIVRIINTANTHLFTISTANLIVTLNNFIFNIGVTGGNPIIRPIIQSTTTYFTLIDCRITTNAPLYTLSQTDKYGFLLHLIGGSFNIVSTYDGGSSIDNIENIESTTTNPMIYADSCPITIDNNYKTIFNDINTSFDEEEVVNGMLILTNSDLYMRNVEVTNIMNSTFVQNLVRSNIFFTYGNTNSTMTFDNCNFSNIGYIYSTPNTFTGIATSNDNVNIIVNNCNISNVVGGYVFYIPNSGSFTMNAITKDCTYSSITTCRFFYGENVTVNIGNNSNYNHIFENMSGIISGTYGRLFHINTLNESIFRNCVVRNISSGGINSGIYVETLSGNLTIENNSFDSVTTDNHIIMISNISSSNTNIIMQDNIFENINNGVLLLNSKCKLIHGNNLLNECTSSTALIVFNNINTESVGTDDTIISNTSSVGINIANSDDGNVLTNFSFSNIDNIALTINNTTITQSINISNCKFNNCNSCINILNSIVGTNFSTILNCLFTNNGNSNGKHITLSNTMCRILECSFTSSVDSNVDGFIVTTNKNLEMINGIITTTNTLSNTYRLIQVTNNEQLTIELYVVNTNHKMVIESTVTNAKYCNFRFTGSDNNNSICIRSDSYNLNGITIILFDTGVMSNDFSTITNSTLSRNQIGIKVNNIDLTKIINIINCTIMDNNIGIEIISGYTIIANTLIASNNTNITINSSFILSLGNNATDIDTISAFTQPTDIISPLVLQNIGPLENNGGIPYTYALLNNNICLNKGNVDYAVSPYDNRGEGYNRIVDGNVDIGSYENQNPIVCFTSDSEVLVDRNGAVKYECVKNIVAGDKVIVKDVSSGEFKSIEVVHNVITGKRKWFIRVEKDGIGMDEPFKTTHFTGGHMLVIGGKEIKARDIVVGSKYNASKVKLNDQNVHSLVLENRSYVNVNGVLNVAFGREEWYRLAKKMNILWRDNKIE